MVCAFPDTLLTKLDNGIVHAEDTNCSKDGNKTKEGGKDSEIIEIEEAGAQNKNDKSEKAEAHIVEQIVEKG